MLNRAHYLFIHNLIKMSHLQLTVARNIVNVKFVIGIFVLLGKRLTVPVEKSDTLIKLITYLHSHTLFLIMFNYTNGEAHCF